MSCGKLSVLNLKVSSRLNTPSFRLLNMKETFGQRLHRLRIAAKLSQTELGRLIGRALGGAPISKGAISQWENDQIGSLKDENLLALARVLKMSPEELKSGTPNTGTLHAPLGAAGPSDGGNVSAAAPPRGRVPVISAVQAGHFKDIVDNHHPGEADEWIKVGVQVRRHTFALIVEGDSMEPEFTEGMRIVVEPDMAPEIGDYVVAGNGEQATLKKLVRDGNDLYLKPLNPRYPIKPLGDSRIIGVVREAHRKYR